MPSASVPAQPLPLPLSTTVLPSDHIWLWLWPSVIASVVSGAGSRALAESRPPGLGAHP